MTYTISEEWVTNPFNGNEISVYTVHNGDPDIIERTFRWYADAERYRDELNDGTSAEAAADPDDYRDLNIDDQMGVR